MKEQYGLIVIGAGPGGYTAAIRAAKYGIPTAVVEQAAAGGTCLNRGCIPTKALLQCAHAFESAADSQRFGVSAENVSFDIERFYQFKDEVSAQLRGGVEELLKANGVDLICGRAKITESGALQSVQVETAEGASHALSCENILIACGSAAVKPPIPGVELPGVMTSDDILKAARVYEHLVIVGGGVIGMEFASVFSALGCKVTVLEAMDRILANMDKEIAQNLKMILKKKGVECIAKALVKEIRRQDGGLSVVYEDKKGEVEISCDGVLIAAGRRAATEGLWDASLAIATQRGRIVTDEHYMTTVCGIYAVGDAGCGVQLAHYAAAEACNAVDIIAGRTPEKRLDCVPSCIYTSPEIACCGISEEQAKERGIAVTTGKFITSANGRSLISAQERGFAKIVCEAESGRIVGAQLMCANASDMISELSLAVTQGLTAKEAAAVIHPHPTYNEAILEALEDVEGMATHIAPKRRPR